MLYVFACTGGGVCYATAQAIPRTKGARASIGRFGNRRGHAAARERVPTHCLGAFERSSQEGAGVSKHTPTPGPWQVEMYGPTHVIRSSDRSIGEAYCSDFDPEGVPAAANARLMSAAPDLLAALEMAKKYLDEYEYAATGESFNSTVINAAIAKARGEA